MKKVFITMLLAVATAATVSAKDIKTVIFTTQPQMFCQNCENKVKGNLRYEKGVKEIQTSLEDQKVTVKYDADKTSPEKLQKAFSKFGYTAKQIDANTKVERDTSHKCENMGSCDNM